MTNVLLVGAGNMAMEYAKVLRSLGITFQVMGRRKEKLEKFTQQFPGTNVFEGGLEKNTELIKNYSHAIVATNVMSLYPNVVALLENGCKNILVEKPAALFPPDIEKLAALNKNKKATVFVAYNRRFFSSVSKARSIIENDGGLLSFHFEFTEWAHVIEKQVADENEKKYLFLNNSTHVVDLAFFIGGKPGQMSAFTSGALPWHNTAIFSGAGITEKNVLFSYHANWLAPGRWGVEFLTKKHRLILKPMEKLQIQAIGSVAVNFAENVDYSVDEQFKPGLFIQTGMFLKNEYRDLCTLEEQADKMGLYKKISGYN